MPDKTNERLEREAREALIAADLSAKMKRWRLPPPGGGNRGNPKLLFLILLLAFGGAAWWLWPDPEAPMSPPPATPAEQPAPEPVKPAPALPEPRPTEPIAQKPAVNRYLALAQAHYRAPDYAADLRGDEPSGPDVLAPARQALAAHRPADALAALEQVPSAYQTDADYLRAHALFELKQYARSAAFFGQLTGSLRYGEAAQWYEILALLPGTAGDEAPIRNRLKKIADDEGHAFQGEAKRLLKSV
jgi:hypothetical protein